MSLKEAKIIQTGTTVPATPIIADATHIPVPSANVQGQIDDLSKAIKAVPSATFTPIPDDSTHIPIPDTTIQGAIDTISKSSKTLKDNLTNTIHFGLAVGQVIAGNHFNKSSDEMWFYTPVNPLGSANGRYIFLKMDQGNNGPTPIILKIIRKKRDGTDYATPYHTFTIPPNQTSPFEAVNQLGFTPILEGEVLYINISASAPTIGLTIGLTYQNLF